jgi:hypothetical protein
MNAALMASASMPDGGAVRGPPGDWSLTIKMTAFADSTWRNSGKCLGMTGLGTQITSSAHRSAARRYS